jgi:5,10-methylenetetrahydromethanopterin reductase
VDVDLILEPNLTPAQITELGQAAEGYGIRGLWMSNYFAHWDPVTSLVPLAERTERLLMGPLAISPFEMHPLKIANGLLTLNEIADGRAMLAMGPGEGNLDAMGLTKPDRQVVAVREAIEIVLAATHRELGTSDRPYQGEFFSVNYPCAYDWIKASPPFIYGTAYRHMMMRMEARVADGVYLGCNTPEMLEAAMKNINIGLGRRERSTENFRINTFWGWHIKEDREAAYRESRKELPWRARKLDGDMLKIFLDDEEVKTVTSNFDNFVKAYFENSDDVEGVPMALRNKLAEYLTSTGGLEDLDREIERFRAFEKAGLTEIAFRLHDDPMDALKIIGERVVNELR